MDSGEGVHKPDASVPEDQAVCIFRGAISKAGDMTGLCHDSVQFEKSLSIQSSRRLTKTSRSLLMKSIPLWYCNLGLREDVKGALALLQISLHNDKSEWDFLFSLL